MSLRRSPTLTSALLASNRLNAKKSTGPRTVRGKAWSRMNRLDDGMHSLEYVDFLKAMIDAPPGRVAETAKAILASKPVILPLFREAAELAIQVEIDICAEQRQLRQRRKLSKNSFFTTTEPGMLLKTNSRRIGTSQASPDHTENK